MLANMVKQCCNLHNQPNEHFSMFQQGGNPLFKSLDETKEILFSTEIKNFGELQRVLQRISNSRAEFPALSLAISSFTSFLHTKKHINNWNFYDHLLPHVIKWSLEKENYKETQSFRINFTKKLTYKTEEVRFILSNAFLLNISSSALNFESLYPRSNELAIERIICQLSYFYQLVEREDEQNGHFIHLYRKNVGNFAQVNWAEENKKINNKEFIKVHTNSMEFSNQKTFVDFANKVVHIGCIIPSLTQEEVLFSTCPELFVSLLLCCDLPSKKNNHLDRPGGDQLSDDEVIVIEGVRRFSHYSGYMNSFRFVDFHREKEERLHVFNTLILDANMSPFHQFRDRLLIRDLNKAYFGFVLSKYVEHHSLYHNNINNNNNNNNINSNNDINFDNDNKGVIDMNRMEGYQTTISTGYWGCGAFGGDKVLKFLQQVLAAKMAGVTLDFSTYNEEDSMNFFNQILSIIVEKEITVATLFHICNQFKDRNQSGEQFGNYVIAKLNG